MMVSAWVLREGRGSLGVESAAWEGGGRVEEVWIPLMVRQRDDAEVR